MSDPIVKVERVCDVLREIDAPEVLVWWLSDRSGTEPFRTAWDALEKTGQPERIVWFLSTLAIEGSDLHVRLVRALCRMSTMALQDARNRATVVPTLLRAAEDVVQHTQSWTRTRNIGVRRRVRECGDLLVQCSLTEYHPALESAVAVGLFAVEYPRDMTRNGTSCVREATFAIAMGDVAQTKAISVMFVEILRQEIPFDVIEEVLLDLDEEAPQEQSVSQPPKSMPN